MKFSHIIAGLISITLVSCTDSESSADSGSDAGADGAGSVALPSESEVDAIDAEAEEAAAGITDTNADETLEALEQLIDDEADDG